MSYGYVEEKETRSNNIGSISKGLESEAEAAGEKIAEAFRAAAESAGELTDTLENMLEPIGLISDNLGLVTQIDLGGMGENLSEIADTLTAVLEKLCETDWIGIAGLIMEVFSQGFGLFQMLNQDLFSSVTGGAGAFKIAMEFLTSPVGLVTVGIAALIAIVVLLVKNWDTVKAALIAGWEAVKQAFSVAAEWFNSNVIQPLVGFFTGLWDQICVIVTNVTTFISTKFQEFTLWIQTAIANVQAVFMGIDAFLQGVFAVDWTTQFGAFGEVLNAFFANVENIWNAVKTIFEGIVTFVQGVFAGDWEAAWDGIVQVFTGIWEGLQAAIKGPINGVIGLINGLVSAVVSGINGAIKALNALRFTVPDWVPEIGGQSIGFNIGMISAPTIPYLAQGAVLPANRPFLAVVGDQKSGTNVEAPLATIQEALANVLAQQGPGDIRITFTGDLAQLARVLKPAIEREERRVGGSLARGVAV